MGLKPGQTNNPRGRPRGKPNLVSHDIRESFSTLIKWYISTDQYANDFLHLRPRERVRHVEVMSNYTIAKLQSIEMNTFTELESATDEQLDRVINQVIETIASRTGNGH